MAVATVEQSYAVAVKQSSGEFPAGNSLKSIIPSVFHQCIAVFVTGSAATGVAIIQRRQIFVVSTSDPEEERCSASNITAFMFTLAISVTYAAMMILGAVHYHDCSDTRMALYTVVQGTFAMLNTAMFAVWIMWRCISYKPIYSMGLLIFFFNLIWCIVGAVWIADSPCKGTRLYSYAVGFSVPMWFLLCLCCCNFCCCRNNDDN